MDDINKRIVKRAQNGDIEAINHIIDYYANLAYFISKNTIKNKSQIEDCANIMLGRLIKKLNLFDPKKSNFKTWVYALFNNAARNYKNALECYNDVFELDDELVFKYVEEKDNDIVHEKLSKIEELVGKESYEILLLKLGYGYKFCEIAEFKNVHESKIKRIFYKAYEQAKEYVENKYE